MLFNAAPQLTKKKINTRSQNNKKKGVGSMFLPDTKIAHFRFSAKEKTLQSNEEVIKYFVDRKKIDSLAFYYLMKVLFTNSTIFDYSSKKLADITGYSTYFIEKHVRILKKEGLAYKQKNNLTFVGRKHLIAHLGLDLYTNQETGRTVKKKRMHKCTLFIYTAHSLFDIKLQLLSKLLQMRIDQQIYIRNLKTDRQKTSPQQSWKKLKQALKKYPSSGETSLDCNILSYRSIASQFKLPLSSCHKLMKEMKEKGFVSTETIKFPIFDAKYLKREQAYPGKTGLRYWAAFLKNSQWDTTITYKGYRSAKDILDKEFGYTYWDNNTKGVWAVLGTNFSFPFFFKQTNKEKDRSIHGPDAFFKFLDYYGVTRRLFT